MFNNNRTLYAGIDLHKNFSYMTVMNKDGYIQHHGKYYHKDIHEENGLIASLLEYNTPIEATVESSYGWYWFADEMQKANISLALAHPKKVHDLVGRKKTDKEDSKALADLLRSNLLPQSYIPSKEERNMKEFLRFRLGLVAQLSTIKRRLHDILAKQNIVCEESDILGKKAKEFLSSYSFPYPYDKEIKTLLSIADKLIPHIASFTFDVKEQCQKDKNALLLSTIPGVGEILALTLSSEIGDVTRFKSERSLAAYAGIVPSISQSADKVHLGEIDKHGNKYIRWALAEALYHTISHDDVLKAFYEKIKEKKGTGKARVAVMNKMIRIIYFMLIRQKPYQVRTIPVDTSINQNAVKTASPINF